MRTSIRSMLQPIALSIAAIAVIGLGQGVVNADEVFIAGSTNGCFGAACAPAASATLLGLTYTNSSFSGTTAGGFRGIGSAPGSPNVNNLGSFALTAAANTYNSSFTLQVIFTDPQGIAGGGTTQFVALVTGTVVSDTIGGVKIDFDNTPILFTFSDTNCGATTIPGQQTTCGNGSFMFSINDVAIDPASTVSLTGQITAAQQTTIPEPTSMLLLGTGLAGIAGLARRKLKART